MITAPAMDSGKKFRASSLSAGANELKL